MTPEIPMTSIWTATCLLALISATTTLLVYWVMVCPVLYRHGAQFPTGLLLHQWVRDLRNYRVLMSARAQTQSWYYVLLVLTWFTIGVATAAIVLRLALSSTAG